jgi:hypothetical protein
MTVDLTIGYIEYWKTGFAPIAWAKTPRRFNSSMTKATPAAVGSTFSNFRNEEQTR